MKNTAKKLAGYGRNGDTELVHMTKDEVKGLHALAYAAGGELTVNPDTGLVEANFLKKMLPTIAGVALTAASGGTLSPLMAGLLVGGVEGVRTGDVSKGLMAGIGGFGGAGLGSALASAGANAAGQAVGNAATQAAGDAATQAAGSFVGNVGTDMAAQAATDVGADAMAQSMAQGMAAPQAASAGIPQVAKPGIMEQMGNSFSNMGKGIQSLDSGKAIGSFIEANKYPLMATAGSVANAATPEYEMPGEDKWWADPKRRYGARYRMDGYQPLVVTPPGFAEGGSVGNAGGYGGGGGIPQLLQGPGDGMSDSIPATIEGRQPARLADGEFVIPADVVSHLGNGSTTAGAKTLYQMMDRIRGARTGKSRQAPEIDPDKYVPA